MNKEHIAQITDIIQEEKVLESTKFINWVEEIFKARFKARGRGRPTKKSG
ncbi:hypothetical protein ACFL0T_01895 [Candidatus Omnitrophota bacterium]